MLKIKLILCSCLIAFGLQAQIAAPLSVVVNQLASSTTSPTALPTIDENGLPLLSHVNHETVVLVQLSTDQVLQQLHLQIINTETEQAVLSQNFDLLTKQADAPAYPIKRDGKVIQIYLGLFALPSNYRCEVKLEDVNGDYSPIQSFRGAH
ncbi:MAG: hypothetical protein AAFP19_14685 [Bacteroidota bacterium]